MKIRVTHEQLNGIMSKEMTDAAGYTDEILLNAGFKDGIKLIDCVIGEIKEDGENYIINPNLSNPAKLPRKVAFREPTAEQCQLWAFFVGQENVIND